LPIFSREPPNKATRQQGNKATRQQVNRVYETLRVEDDEMFLITAMTKKFGSRGSNILLE
jgi:hypothetical protein